VHLNEASIVEFGIQFGVPIRLGEALLHNGLAPQEANPIHALLMVGWSVGRSVGTPVRTGRGTHCFGPLADENCAWERGGSCALQHLGTAVASSASLISGGGGVHGRPFFGRSEFLLGCLGD